MVCSLEKIPDSVCWATTIRHQLRPLTGLVPVSGLTDLLLAQQYQTKDSKLDKLPEYLRDTVDWFMGYESAPLSPVPS